MTDAYNEQILDIEAPEIVGEASTSGLATSTDALKGMYRQSNAELAGLQTIYNQRRETLERIIADANAAFEEQNKELIAGMDRFREAVTAAETELRKRAIEHYNLSGEKSLDENIGVQVRTKLVYETSSAVAWAEVNAPVFIEKSVNKKAFEKVAEGLPFVTVEKNVSAVIRGLDR